MKTTSSENTTPPEPLSSIVTPLGDADILERVRALSRAGRLPGLRTGGPSGVLFRVDAFGWVFDYDLVGVRAGSEVRFGLEVQRLWPSLFILVCVLSVFPGVWLTDSMLSTYFSWYPREFWKTCAWYLPLTILPMPWAWSTAMKRSRLAADASARETIEKLRAALS